MGSSCDLSANCPEVPTLEELEKNYRQAHRFEVVCAIPHRKERAIIKDRSYEDAQRFAQRLSEIHQLRHPRKSSWTQRLYWSRVAR